MTGKIDLEPKNREDRDSCSPGELCCLCSYIPTWNGVGGFFGTISLGSSTWLIQQPEKGRREQEVRDRLNGSLLINFRFFSPLPNPWRYAIHRGTAAAALTHIYRAAECVSEVRGTLEAWMIQCRLQSRFLFLYTCGAVGGTVLTRGDLTQHPAPCHECSCSRRWERKREAEYVSNRSPDRFSFLSAQHTEERWDKHNPEGQARCFLLLPGLSIGFSYSARHSSRAEKSATGIVSWKKSFVINGAYASVGSW
jgi:hypothetical protein